jgi:hypothetical protein
MKLLIASAIFLGVWLASPSDEDFKTCEKMHSRETCIHSIMPN